ncbi:MAG: [LysW]-aminoadipate/[LysW]-glutamate kinase [Nitrososphaerota archaeon]|nr:[LysW]-aminoadipate/[LysW]-glutamate kinase [Candidatus Bathyarchaeota archaeon]MDW8048432.1 [LysW]-aminoadipate/[LysW]-glutamate kinase [Nitrososphaerota archaeon]
MIILKFGGDIFKGMTDTLVNDVKSLLGVEKVVIVHGGGDEVTEIAERLGKKQVFVTSPGGIRSRYTDRETAEIYTMVMAGRINKAIVQRLVGLGVHAVGISGVDAGLLKAERKKRLVIIDERNRKRVIEGGFTGRITAVETKILNVLVDNGYVPVVAPVAIGEENEFLNVDADRAAGQIAGALKAEHVVFLTDVEGVILNDKYVRKMTLWEAEKALPKIGPGMDKKVMASIEALKMGVKEAIISTGFIEAPVTSALTHNVGTVITIG